MPDAVQNSSWQHQLKSYDKAKKRLMTGAEAAERDANKREREAAQEACLRQRELNTPPPPSETMTSRSISSFLAPEPTLAVPDDPATSFEGEKEEKEEEIDKALIPPPSTAPAALQVSRAGRKEHPQ